MAPPGAPYFLTSAGLGFRCWTAGDLMLARSLWGDSEVTRLIGGPFSQEQIAQKLRTEIVQQESAGVQYWPIFLLASSEFAGCCGLRSREPQQGIYELGFHLRPAFWGRGLATEAARAAIGYAFQELRAASVFAGHHPENHASRRVLERLGFRYTHDEFYPPTGRMHRCYLLERRGAV